MNFITPLFQVYKLSLYTFLTSFILDFTLCLPTTKKYMKFNTDLPEDFSKLLIKWRKYATHQM